MSSAPESPPLPGPVDRESFFSAQRRHRRAAKLLTLMAGFAVVLVSVPLAAIVFPLIFFVLGLLSMLGSAMTHTHSVVDVILASGGRYGEGPNAIRELMILGLVIVLPGSLLMLWIWRRILQSLRSIPSARFAELFGARLLHVGDLEERQVANIVEELAIAAGIPAPAVRIVDSEMVNAAAIVPDAHNALVLVTRGMLDRCDRADTQALLGSTVAMIANGDAQAAFRWMGVAGTFNIAADLLQGPLAIEARERLKVLIPGLRSGTLASASGEPLPEAARAIALLLGSPPTIPDNDDTRGKVKTALVFPFLFASAMFNMAGFLANLLFLSPALALLTRRRVYLADATAVQLTRDPDSLAKGLNLTVNHTAAGDWPLARFRSVFVVAPDRSGTGIPTGQAFGTHPSPGARHDRVVRMGAMASSQGASPSPLSAVSGPRRWLVFALLAVLGVLGAVLVPLALYVIIAVTMLALAVGMMYVMIVLAPLHWLLG